VIDMPGGGIYFVADSGYGNGHYFRSARERHGPFALAALPIGAYEPRWFMRDHHMNPAEAVQALIDCGEVLRWPIITARSNSPMNQLTRHCLRLQKP
jgi:L-ascorbate metabolism protein UlaG (beta-lactamase superfamily)